AVDLDAVACRHDDRLVDRGVVGRPAVGLHEVLVGERQAFEEFDRGAPVGDAEGEDGHGSRDSTRRLRMGSDGWWTTPGRDRPVRPGTISARLHPNAPRRIWDG